MNIALDGLILIAGCVHVILAPYTKVEESFNLHATHDVLFYGIGSDALKNYDHFTFPGAVPRTFIGSILLASLSKPVIQLASWQGLVTEKAEVQIIIRLILACLNACGLCLLQRSVSRRFGRLTGLFFTLLTISQFHLPFWMGRTVPNMFALLPVNVATSMLINRAPNALKPSKWNTSMAISLLTFTVVIFRAEVFLLLVPILLQSLLNRYITFTSMIKIGLVSGFLSIALTIFTDSYFWDKPYIWPEIIGLYFNVYQGKSSEWGISPPFAYWTTHLPKLLLSSLPLSFIGILLDRRIRTLILPSFLFIGLISGLGHKEWRFIIYIVPIFNIAAARGARWMVSRPKGTIIGRFFFLFVIASLAFNFLITFLLTLTSVQNYPGGQALALFHRLYPLNQTHYTPHIHISNLAAQSGASLFQQTNSPPHPSYLTLNYPIDKTPQWIYNKTESLSLSDLSANKLITHLISETSPDPTLQYHWNVVGIVKGFERWDVDWAGMKTLSKERIFNVVSLRSGEKLWILERKGR